MHSPLSIKQKNLFFILSVVCIILLSVLAPSIVNSYILALLFLIPVTMLTVWAMPKASVFIIGFACYMSVFDYYINTSFHLQPHVYLFVLISFLFYGLSQYTKGQAIATTHNDSYNTLFNSLSDAACVLRNNVIEAYNSAFLHMSGFSKKELANLSFADLIHIEDRKKPLLHCVNHKTQSKCNQRTFRLVKKDKSVIYVKAQLTQAQWESASATFCILTDVTDLQQKEEKKKAEDKNNALLLAQMQSGLLFCEFINDTSREDCIILKTNKRFNTLFDIDSHATLEGSLLNDSLPILSKLFDKIKDVAKGGPKVQAEFFVKKLDKFFEYYIFSPNPNQCAVFFNDITQRKKLEEKAEFLNTHDQITGLYNERYLEKELNRYNNFDSGKTSIIVAQLNSIKLVNNAFKHLSWTDAVLKFAEILKKECRELDIITKEGRDKFVVVLPNTDDKKADQIMQNIQAQVAKETEKNPVFSAAMGHSTKNDIADDINDVYEQAKNNMYKNKLLMSDQLRESSVQAILNALYGISDLEQGHANNVSEMSASLARALNIPNYEVEQIKTAALLHDVGNISIDPAILTKEGKYTDEEWKILKKHPEAGYRILSNTGVYKHIAKYILEHHEKWDGTGYPKGLKGEEILLPSRIIAIADAFDAMTTDKPYKKACSLEEALEELKKNAGKQFDPHLVDVFIEKVLPTYKTP